ncbi:MAG: DUF2333 family protein [Pseudomonadota bacterium]
MTRVIDFFVEVGEMLLRFVGLGRREASDNPYEGAKRGGMRRMLRWLWPLALLFLIAWTATMIYRFSYWRGVSMDYPQQVLAAFADAPLTDESTAANGEDGAQAAGQGTVSTCSHSRTVDMQSHLIDMMVNQNDWVPATPQYTIGVFGVVEWAATPYFDNKAAFQSGVLQVVRRFSLDLADSLGRVRGTSGADPDLQGAASRLRTNERAWVFNNPFDPQLQLMATSAAASYRGAIGLYNSFNMRLEDCNALFDARADNLLRLLDRIAADLGDMNDRLQKRSRAEVWDVNTKTFVPGEGNDAGWFDFRADNLFHEARGQMYALHGLLQALRIDFGSAVEAARLEAVWDRMEAHVAEGARFNPLIVSNGPLDGIFAPDHLAVMGEKILRARANMVELRDILEN